MTRLFIQVGLCTLLLASGGNGADPKSSGLEEEPENQGAEAGSPGNLTVRMALLAGLDMVDGTWSLSEVALRLCDGSEVTAVVESGAVRVDGVASVALPAFPLELAVASISVDVSEPFDSTEAALRLELGGTDWVRADWLGLVPGAHVTIRDGHPQHDTIVGRLAEVTLMDETSGEGVGASEAERTEPSMHLAVGKGGWVMASFDDGWSWTEHRAAVDAGTEADLFAVAVSDASVAVAVGGYAVGTVLQSQDGTTFEEVSIETRGLRDVVWTRTMFLAVGLEGQIATSVDGLAWEPRSALGACHFHSIAQLDADLIFLGHDDREAGCVWSSADGGASFDEKSGLPAAVVAVQPMDDGVVTIGTSGLLSWTLDRGVHWSSVVLDDSRFFGRVYWEGWVTVLWETNIHDTTDFVTISEAETPGFTGFVPSLGDEVLLAVTDDGEVWQVPGGGVRDLADWDERGSMGRSEWGYGVTDLAAWVR